MPFLSQGSDALVAIPAGRAMRVGALRGSTATVTLPMDLAGGPIAIIKDTQSVLGPYPRDVTVGILASVGEIEYIVGASPALTDQVYSAPAVSSSLPVNMTLLPGHVDGRAEYNQMTHDSAVFAAGYYWNVYWNGGRAATLARRSPNSNVWETFDLNSISGNPLANAVYDDLHNYFSMAISGDGKIHISGNMHTEVTYLRYVRGHVDTWNQAGSWAAAPMIGGATEDSVTYPCFVDLDGDLLFHYRDGGSGNGVWYLNRYSQATGLWTRVNQLFGNGGVPGGDADSSAYPTRMVRTANGKLHVAYTWRNTTAADSNYSIFYVESTDDGVSWKTINGEALTLPLQPTQLSARALTTAITGSGLINQQNSGLAIDADGLPHIVYQIKDSVPYTQVVYTRRVNNAWVSTNVTKFKTLADVTGTILHGVVPRPDVFCSKSGKVFCIMRHNGEWRGTVRLLDITDPTDVKMGTLIDIDLYSWEPCYSGQILQKTGKIMMMANATVVNYSQAPAIDYQHTERWGAQVGMMIEIDPEQAIGIVQGMVNVPMIEVLASNTIGEGSTAITSNANPGQQYGSPILPVNLALKQQRLAVRLSGIARKSTSGTLTIRLRESYGTGTVDPTQSTRVLEVVGPPSGTQQPVAFLTPWTDMAGLTSQTQYSYFEVFASSSTSNDANIWSLTAQLGRYALGRPAQNLY